MDGSTIGFLTATGGFSGAAIMFGIFWQRAKDVSERVTRIEQKLDKMVEQGCPKGVALDQRVDRLEKQGNSKG